MSSERWERTKQILEEALRLPPEQRPLYLEQACGADVELRADVESLISSHEEAGGEFLAAAAPEIFDLTTPSKFSDAQLGQTIAHYRLLGELGRGGMGVVYKAEDIRLHRFVALKFLPSQLGKDEQALARFRREAQTASVLNHPNICTLYDIGEADGRAYIALEYLEGTTLNKLIANGPLPVETVLTLAIGISDGLEAAHAKGVVHRDLKPGNIMLTRSGAKLLDFGLAKFTVASAQRARISSIATADSNITEKGEIVGTFQYMAPEQLEGKEADARTDIFALGAVLYEMATGRPAFQGKTPASLIASIMNSEPAPITTLQPLTPPALDRVIKTCIAKDPDERWQSAHDVKLQLKWILEGGSQAGLPAPVAARRKLRESAAWVAVGVLALIACVLAIAYLQRAPKPAQAIRFTVEAPGQPFDYLVSMLLSPDGRMLAFVANDTSLRPWLWLRPLDSTETARIRGTEGASDLAWSADSKSLFFVVHNKIKQVGIAGGPIETRCDLPQGANLGDSVNQNNDLLFFSDHPIQKISMSDCGIKTVAPWDREQYDVGETWPTFLPDGHHFIYSALRNNKRHDIYSGSLDGKPGNLLVHDAAAPIYSAGYLFFERDGYLSTQPFDPAKMRLSGEAVAVERKQLAFDGRGGIADYSVAGNVLAYHEQVIAPRQLSWRDLNGNLLHDILEPAGWKSLHISPDGAKILASKGDPLTHTGDLWVIDADGKTAAKVTHENPIGAVIGVWSRDGKQMALGAVMDSPSRILTVQRADGTRERLPSPHPNHEYQPLDWSPDGKAILYMEEDTAVGITRLGVYPLTEGAQPYYLFEKQEANWDDARFSPDGRWISYSSDESGRLEVYVMPYGRSGRPLQISSQGGRNARWMPDGRHLLYFNDDNQVVSLALQLGASVQVGNQHSLFQLPPAGSENLPDFEVAPDGKKLLVAVSAGSTSAPLTVVVNWQAELAK